MNNNKAFWVGVKVGIVTFVTILFCTALGYDMGYRDAKRDAAKVA